MILVVLSGLHVKHVFVSKMIQLYKAQYARQASNLPRLITMLHLHHRDRLSR